MNYSAKALYNVLIKYTDEKNILYPTRRKYLIHLLNNLKINQDILIDELKIEEEKAIKAYKEKLEEIKTNMLKWIREQKTITLNVDISSPRFPRDPCYFKEYKQEIIAIKYVYDDYVVLKNDCKYKINPNDLEWKSYKDFIKYSN